MAQDKPTIQYPDARRVQPVTPAMLLDLVPKPEEIQRAARTVPSATGATVNAGAFFDEFYLGSHYLTAFNQGLAKPMGTPDYRYLRKAYDVSTIDRVVVAARRNQIRHISRLISPRSKGLGISVLHQDKDDIDIDTGTPEILGRCKYALQILKRFDSRVHANFTNFLVAAVEDYLIYDRMVLVKERNFRGEVLRYWSLDPIHIRPVVEVLMPEILKRARKKGVKADLAVQTILGSEAERKAMLADIERRTGFDLTNAAWVQVVDDRIKGAWTADQMSVYISNPRNRINHIYYGKSAFEDSLEMTDLFLAAWQYNKQLFNQEYPENLLILPGGYNKESLSDFKERLKSAGRSQDKRIAVVSMENEEFTAGGAMVHKLRESPRDMAFMEMLNLCINLKLATYRMHPSVINIKQQAGGSGFSFEQAGSEELKISMANEEGFHSLAYSICSWLTDELIHPTDDELMVVPLNLDKQDPLLQAEILEKNEVMTVDEERAAQGLPPLGGERGKRLCSVVGVQIDTAIATEKIQKQGLQQTQDLALLQMDQQLTQQSNDHEHELAVTAMKPKPKPAASSTKKSMSAGRELVFALDINLEDDDG